MYDELFEVWRREKESSEIQKLSEDFYGKLAGYVKRLREESRMLDEKSVRARLLRLESKNAKFLVEELIRLRYEKILNETKNVKPVPEDRLTTEEKQVRGRILPSAEFYQAFLKDILMGRLANIEGAKKTKGIVLRFLKDVPAVVGIDMKVYGPFKSEDVGVLPSENAKILMKHGDAAEIEVK